jgi:hypothetical protein
MQSNDLMTGTLIDRKAVPLSRRAAGKEVGIYMLGRVTCFDILFSRNPSVKLLDVQTVEYIIEEGHD